MKNIVHIFGASGSGTSTLGQYIGEQLGYTVLDSDDYFWLPTSTHFTVKREPAERIALMKRDIERAENVVISGSLASWGDPLIPMFTLAVRLITETSERLRRIRAREYGRFGERILPGGDMFEQHQAFLKWASEYDDGPVTMRSKRMHNEWQKQLSCKLLTLSGSDPLAQNFEAVRKELDIYWRYPAKGE